MKLLHQLSIKSIAGSTAILTCLLVGAGQMAAAPQPPGPFSRNPDYPARIETALDANTSAAVLATAGKTRDVLGFPVGVTCSAKHVRDGFTRTEYDEVSELDSAGQVRSLTQFDSKGHLSAAVRFDAVAAGGPRVTRDAAIGTAQRSARSAGLTVGAPTLTDADEATGGWTIHWARQANGVAVRGDETRVQVRSDGRIQSVARIEHELAAAPSQRIDSDTARKLATDKAKGWFSGRNIGYSITGPTLEWVEPNGAFDPARVTDAPQAYKLAWVADVKPSGDAAAYVWLISLFVDAADGSVIGGDFVE
jgi:hypothetical protein